MKTDHGSKLTGAEMALMIDEFVNASGKDKYPEFVETLTLRTHRTLQQKIMGLFVASIEGWAKCAEERQFDARNEATVKLAKKMIDATGDKYDRGLPYI